MNHPRTSENKSTDFYYLQHLIDGQPYDPNLPLSNAVNKSLIEQDKSTGLRDIDIDVLEVANGFYYDNYIINRKDWFSFLQQGELIYASANSDSHGNTELIAIPRNYVYVGDDEISNFDEKTFIHAVSDGKFIGSSGPLMSVEAIASESKTAQAIGTLVSGSQVELLLTVASAAWVDVNELRIYVNGSLHQTREIKPNDKVAVKLDLVKDSFVVFELDGTAGEIYKIVAPKHKPMAFTNPVFIDADNDGEWTAPGLIAGQ